MTMFKIKDARDGEQFYTLFKTKQGAIDFVSKKIEEYNLTPENEWAWISIEPVTMTDREYLK